MVAAVGEQLRDSLDTNVQGFQLLTDDDIRHAPSQVVYQQSQTVALRERDGVVAHTSFPSGERSELTVSRNPSAVDGTTINLSPFSWAVRPLEQDARNQTTKVLVSLTPEMKMGVFLGRCPAGAQVVATFALRVVPVGVPLRGPDMSLDMRLYAVPI